MTTGCVPKTEPAVALAGCVVKASERAAAGLIAMVVEVAPVDGELKITLANQDIDHSIVADVLVRGGAKLIELREDEIGLEEVFMRVTRGETQ